MLDIRDLAEIASPATANPSSPPPGSIHFSLDGVPERDRPAMFREFFGREVIKYDLERLPDVPSEMDVTLQAMPGLMNDVGPRLQLAKQAHTGDACRRPDR